MRMKTLPGQQLGKGPCLTSKLQIEPETEGMQSHFGCQARPKPRHVMRSFASQAEGVERSVIYGFNDLSEPSEPATQGFGSALLA